jgi:hypothetical protein
VEAHESELSVGRRSAIVRERDMGGLERDLRTGMGYGVAYAAFYSAFVLVLALVVGERLFAGSGTSLVRVVLGYVAAGVGGGLVVGLLLPLGGTKPPFRSSSPSGWWRGNRSRLWRYCCWTLCLSLPSWERRRGSSFGRSSEVGLGGCAEAGARADTPSKAGRV